MVLPRILLNSIALITYLSTINSKWINNVRYSLKRPLQKRSFPEAIHSQKQGKYKITTWHTDLVLYTTESYSDKNLTGFPINHQTNITRTCTKRALFLC